MSFVSKARVPFHSILGNRQKNEFEGRWGHRIKPTRAKGRCCPNSPENLHCTVE